MATATQKTTQTSYGAMNSAGNTFTPYIDYSTMYVGHDPNDEESNGYVARFRFPSMAYASDISLLKLYLYFKGGYTSSYRVYVSSNANLTPYQVVNGSATLLGTKSISPADGGAVAAGKFFVMDLAAYGDIINDFAGAWYLYLYKPPQAAGRSQFQGGATSGNAAYLDVTYTPYTACTAPSSASLSAAVSEGDVTLTYSDAAGGEANEITAIEAQYSESDDNATWGAWTAYKTVSTSSGSGSFSVAPSSTRAKYRRFQVRVRGAAGADWYSPWKVVTGSVRKNSAPAAPGVTAPVDSKIIYNDRPRILAAVGSDADGHTQTLASSGYAASTGGAQAAGKKLVLRRASAAAAGAQSVSVSSTDVLGAASSATARSFTYAVPSWTDPGLVAGLTLIKAIHMAELRAAVDNVRAYYGLAAYAWSTITAGVAGACGLAGWSDHVHELRTAIDQVVALVNGWDTANGTNDISLPTWIVISENKPAAAVIQQLRDAIPLL